MTHMRQYEERRKTVKPKKRKLKALVVLFAAAAVTAMAAGPVDPG